MWSGIREIRQAVGKEVVIRVDANQGWTREEAVSTITAMEDAGLGIELDGTAGFLSRF